MVSTKKLPDGLFDIYHTATYRAVEAYQLARLAALAEYPEPKDLDSIAEGALPIARAMYEGPDEDLLTMNKTILSAIVMQSMMQTGIPGVEKLVREKVDELNITLRALVD